MSAASLVGRRIHIAGSISQDPGIASAEEVQLAREFIAKLVADLIRKGASFVVPVDVDPKRPSDNVPTLFDWLVWEAIGNGLASRPSGAAGPLAVAVQHHKTEGQIPADRIDLWDKLRMSDLVSIDNASYWNMASKRMEMQSRHGDILIAIGGSEGVHFLANLYHQAGKTVIPLNFALCPPDAGARKLFSQALISQQSSRFFRVDGSVAPHDWINRLNFTRRHSAEHRVEQVVRLLESLERPAVFAVRLLNAKHPDFKAVDDFFAGIVKPVVEKLGYVLKVVDGVQPNEYPRIDAEIFGRLHRSPIVVADITGSRPNCFIELGYALGRSIPTMLTASDETESPFDVNTVPCHKWSHTRSLTDSQRLFLEYWQANIKRPSLVVPDPLVP